MIELQIDEYGIATLTIQQQRAMNVIDWTFAAMLNERIDQIAHDSRVTGVILTSAKRSFMAGADLAIMADFVAPGVALRDAARMIGCIGTALRRIETLGKPVVGASTGTALGGGLELLLACHHRIAVDEPGAVYGLPEVSLGLLPGAGGTQRLPRMLGIEKALQLMVSGRHLKTDEARNLGILDEVVSVDQLLPAARRALMDGRVAAVAPWDQKGYRLPGGDSNSPAANELFLLFNGDNFGRTHGLRPAPQAIASCVYEGSRLPIDRALRIEQMYFAQLVQGREAQAMIQTLFFARQVLEKAPGRPAQVPRSKLVRVAIAGDEPWQRGLKAACEAAGLQVASEDDANLDLSIGEGAGQVAVRWFRAGTDDLPPVVEIAPCAENSDVQIARAFDLARQLRAVPVLLSPRQSNERNTSYIGACINASLAVAQQYLESGIPSTYINNALIARGWPSLASMAAAVGQAWPRSCSSSSSTDKSLDVIAAGIGDAQTQVAKATTAADVLSLEAANLAAVLGAGYPRHLGGPLFSTNRGN